MIRTAKRIVCLSLVCLFFIPGAGSAAEFLRIRGRTIHGEVIESQGQWRGRPMALIFWSMADKSTLPVLKAAGPLLDRLGYTRLAVHPDQRQDLVKATLLRSLPEWDSLPDTAFSLAEALKVDALPTLVLFKSTGAYDMFKGAGAIHAWAKKAANTKPPARKEKLTLYLLPEETPLLVTTAVALVSGPAGIRRLDTATGQRQMLLAQPPQRIQVDEAGGFILVLNQTGDLWRITLKGVKSILSRELSTFCFHSPSGRLGLVRADGAFAEMVLGQKAGPYSGQEHYRGCTYAAGNGELVLYR